MVITADRATLEGLGASADRVAQLVGELEAERERRNAMVVDLVDQGIPRRAIADRGRVSPKTICVCLSESG